MPAVGTHSFFARAPPSWRTAEAHAARRARRERRRRVRQTCERCNAHNGLRAVRTAQLCPRAREDDAQTQRGSARDVLTSSALDICHVHAWRVAAQLGDAAVLQAGRQQRGRTVRARRVRWRCRDRSARVCCSLPRATTCSTRARSPPSAHSRRRQFITGDLRSYASSNESISFGVTHAAGKHPLLVGRYRACRRAAPRALRPQAAHRIAGRLPLLPILLSVSSPPRARSRRHEQGGRPAQQGAGGDCVGAAADARHGDRPRAQIPAARALARAVGAGRVGPLQHL